MSAFFERLHMLLNESELSEMQTKATLHEIQNPSDFESWPVSKPVLCSSSNVDTLGAEYSLNEDHDFHLNQEEEKSRAAAYDLWQNKGGSQSVQNAKSRGIIQDLAELKLDRAAAILPAAIKSLGYLAPKDLLFCPIVAISKYPYKFVDHRLREPIAQQFFTGGKFWERSWDIFYTWPPYRIAHKALLLVPAVQVERFLAEINEAFETAFLTLSSECEDIGLTIRFSDHPDLTPRYLGESRSRTELYVLEQRVPSSSFRPVGEKAAVEPPTAIEVTRWKRKVEASLEQTKITKKNRRAATEAGRTEKKQKWSGDLKMTEIMLGFLPRNRPKLPKEKPGMSWDEIKEVIRIQEEGYTIPPIDISKPPPFPFYNSVIFIVVDVELKEGNSGVMTEVGISTLDTNDLIGLSPGKQGENWISSIRSRHFRIQEHLHHVNRNFVRGCPDQFEFGTSEVVRHADLHGMIASCLSYPYSGEGLATENAIPRNLVLVGHDVKSDLRALQAVGCHLYNFVEFYKTIDTTELFRALKHEWNPTSLGAILYQFNIAGWNLHNAGNDAAYTMQAMLAIAIAKAERRGSPENEKETNEKQAHKMIDAAKEAMQRVAPEGDGWDTD